MWIGKFVEAGKLEGVRHGIRHYHARFASQFRGSGRRNARYSAAASLSLLAPFKRNASNGDARRRALTETVRRREQERNRRGPLDHSVATSNDRSLDSLEIRCQIPQKHSRFPRYSTFHSPSTDLFQLFFTSISLISLPKEKSCSFNVLFMKKKTLLISSFLFYHNFNCFNKR